MNRTGLALAALALLGTSDASFAQTARSAGGGAASAQLLQQMQQLASERTSLQAENEKLKRDLEAIKKERDALKSGHDAVDRRVRSAESALARTAAEQNAKDAELAQFKDKMQELVARFRETAQQLRDAEAAGATEKANLAARDVDLKKCVAGNDMLYKLNGELLDRLEHPGMFSGVARAEPFTKLARVRMENLVDDYRGRAADHKVTAPAAPASTEPAHP